MELSMYLSLCVLLFVHVCVYMNYSGFSCMSLASDLICSKHIIHFEFSTLHNTSHPFIQD